MYLSPNAKKKFTIVAKGKDTSVYFDRALDRFVGIDEAVTKQLKDAYFNLDLDKELLKMGVWLQSPKGKKRHGTIGFILNWLNNASPSPPSNMKQLDFADLGSPLRPYLMDYLEDLWKDREHLFEFNRIRR